MSKNSKPISVEHSVKFTYKPAKSGKNKQEIIITRKKLERVNKFNPGDICVINEIDHSKSAINAILSYPTFIVDSVRRLHLKEPALIVLFADEKTGISLIMLKSSIRVTKRGFDQSAVIHPDNLTKIGEL